MEIKFVNSDGQPQDPAIISGGDVKDAFRSRDSFGRPSVGFSLTADAAARFGQFTSENIGRSLAGLLEIAQKNLSFTQEELEHFLRCEDCENILRSFLRRYLLLPPPENDPSD